LSYPLGEWVYFMKPAAAPLRRAALSEAVSVRTDGGDPLIKLEPGRALLAPYSGPAPAARMLEKNLARPLALASADFDEDGVADLISGYAAAGGGVITLLRGNVDSIYPNSPAAQRRKSAGELTAAPFLSPAAVFELGEPPDFIAAGDFDADGHRDVVAAARGGHSLHLLAGDGRGGLAAPERVEMPGAVTALASGEVNRRDGLDDLAVGVSDQTGPRALVFQGQAGALRSKADSFALSAEATSIAMGQLDGDFPLDLAVAGGRELVIQHGFDNSDCAG
jgi:hypothetical protein